MNPDKKKQSEKLKTESSRFVAITILKKVLQQGQSLSSAKLTVTEELAPRDRSFAMELVHGVLRWRWKLEFFLDRLMKKPLRAKDQDVQILLLVGLYELIELSTPDYASVNEAVQLVKRLGKTWARGMVNAVLRSFLREQEKLMSELEADDVASYSHPQWMLEKIRNDWPQHWQQILAASNQRPPMWLRVNRQQLAREDYIKILHDKKFAAEPHAFAVDAIRLETAADVFQLPSFDEGQVSIQDAGAQLAATLLDAERGDRVLDLCAAPGGKTCHILEQQSELKALVAVELDATRMQRVEENLQRSGLTAECIVGDATQPEQWWNEQAFDRILVDAPCSASGVIRRHPDIKSLRRPDDLTELVTIQQNILQQAWRLLKPGGRLLYVTCSVFRQENECQIQLFLQSHDDAKEKTIELGWGNKCEHGWQLLPGGKEPNTDSDGFYYACLCKTQAP